MELIILAITTASVAFFHTLFGPDHYLPFIAMARAGRWPAVKTAWVTILCGIGHIGSSVLLGMAGVALGFTMGKIKTIEAFRGSVATWALIAFGFSYFIWGLHRALRNRPHKHWHAHPEEDEHIHEHTHIKWHTHVHNQEGGTKLTPWVLFTIFIFGPCEPLIPMLMYPVARGNFAGLLLVTGIFGAVTILTMLSIVLIAISGVRVLHLGRIQRYSHALAGAMVCLCGIAIQIFGL